MLEYQNKLHPKSRTTNDENSDLLNDFNILCDPGSNNRI